MKTLLFTVASFIYLTGFSQAPTIEWQNILRGNQEDYINKTIQATQGYYISVGVTNSTQGDLPNYYGGGYDSWITKTDANGNFIWKKTIGGSLPDHLFDIIQCNDNNFIACGYNSSSDGDLSSIPFSADSSGLWLVKFDDNGTILWQKRVGGKGGFYNVKIKESANGQLNIFTTSNAHNSYVTTHYGDIYKYDIVYFLLSANGSIINQKTFGGSENEYLTDICETDDGDFIVLTSSYSIDHDITNHIDSIYTANSWVFKIDGAGNMLWEKSFLNQSIGESTRAIKSLSNGNIIFTYEKNSFISNTYTDGRVIMLSSNGNLIWEKDFGGSDNDVISDILEFGPGHIIMVGATWSDSLIVNSSNGGIWLLDIDYNGNTNWQTTYNFNGIYGSYYKLQKTNDNGLMLSSNTQPSTPGCLCSDASFIKFSQLTTDLIGIQRQELISIYPNPAKDFVTVNLKNRTTDTQYQIINAIGQTVLSGTLRQENSTINTNELAHGIYFIQIDGQEKQSYKFIKE